MTGQPEVRVLDGALAVHLPGAVGNTWAVLEPVNGHLAMRYRTTEQVASFAPAAVLTEDDAEELAMLLWPQRSAWGVADREMTTKGARSIIRSLIETRGDTP